MLGFNFFNHILFIKDNKDIFLENHLESKLRVIYIIYKFLNLTIF